MKRLKLSVVFSEELRMLHSIISSGCGCNFPNLDLLGGGGGGEKQLEDKYLLQGRSFFLRGNFQTMHKRR